MVKRNGGYAIVVHDDANIYNEVKVAYENHKPILFYDDDNTCYFIDTIKKDNDDNYILTKGGKTFTITINNTLSSEGLVSNPTMENIKDLNGNLRFVEGEGVATEIEGVTYNFNKWSLSGSHLMFVLSGEVENGTAISGAQTYSTYEVPKWLYDKIIPYVNNRVEIKGQYYYDNSYGSQTATSLLIKDTVTETIKIVTSAITLNANRSFRVQFDLLIDAE